MASSSKHCSRSSYGTEEQRHTYHHHHGRFWTGTSISHCIYHTAAEWIEAERQSPMRPARVPFALFAQLSGRKHEEEGGNPPNAEVRLRRHKSATGGGAPRGDGGGRTTHAAEEGKKPGMRVAPR